VETTWQKKWFAYLLSTTVSWCSCGKTTIIDEWSVICLSTECCLSEKYFANWAESTEWHAAETLSFYCCYIRKREQSLLCGSREG
jgi:hypothetical protein